PALHDTHANLKPSYYVDLIADCLRSRENLGHVLLFFRGGADHVIGMCLRPAGAVAKSGAIVAPTVDGLISRRMTEEIQDLIDALRRGDLDEPEDYIRDLSSALIRCKADVSLLLSLLPAPEG